MNVLAILVPASLVLGALGLVAVIWSIRSNQFDDLEGDAWRILQDDEGPSPD